MAQFNTIVLCDVNTRVLDVNNLSVLNYWMKFSQRLKAARKHAGISQQELALRVGCSQGAISKIERGDQEESTLVVKFAVSCGVSPIWLDSGEGEMITQDSGITPKTPQQEKVLLSMQRMDGESENAMVKISDSLAEPQQNGSHPPGKPNKAAK